MLEREATPSELMESIQASHAQRSSANEKLLRSETAEYLRVMGETESSLKFKLKFNADVTYWRVLYKRYGDFGGNVQPDGVKVRTPFAGPPPQFWSSRQAFDAWSKRNDGGLGPLFGWMKCCTARHGPYGP